MRRRLLSAFAVAAFACSDPAPSSGLSDAGTRPDAFGGAVPPELGALDEGPPDEARFVVAPAPPRLSGISAAPPQPGPCPTGWGEVALGDGHACDAPATRADCRVGEVSDVDGACRAFAAECPGDGWPADLPAEGAVVFVDPAAPPPGDGRRAAPYASLAEAIGAAPESAVIALRTGDHRGPLTLGRSLSLRGACASGTRIVADTPDEEQAVLQVDGPARLRELTVTGARPALDLGREGETTAADLVVERVVVDGAVGRAIAAWPGSRFTADWLWVRDVAPNPSDGFGGFFLFADGATVDLRGVVFEDGGRIGVLARDGAELTVEDGIVRRVTQDAETLGLGLFASSDARVSLDRVLVEGVYESAIWASGASVDASMVAIRDVVDVRRNVATGHAVYAELGGRVRVRGGSVRGVGPIALIGFDTDTRLEFSDLWLSQIRPATPLLPAIAGRTGTDLTVERVWIDGKGGVSVGDPPSRAAIRDLTYRGSTDGFGLNLPALLAFGGIRTVTATAIDVRAAGGVSVLGVDTQARVRGLRVRHEGVSSFGTYVEEGTLTLREAELDDADDLCVAVDRDGTLLAEDVVVRRASVAVSGINARSVRVSRLRAEDCTGAGVYLIGGEGRIEDVTVDGLTAQTSVGAAVNLTAGATAALSRFRSTDLRGYGLMMWEGVRADIEDVFIEAAPEPLGTPPQLDFGLYVHPTAALDAERVFVRRFGLNAMIDGRADIRDLSVVGQRTGVSSVGLGGRGDIELARGRFVESAGIGMLFWGDGRVDARDVVIDGVEVINQVSMGLAVVESAEVTGTRLEVLRTRTGGVWAADTSRVALRDVKVADAKPSPCADLMCDLEEVAAGVFAQDDASIDLERFEVARMGTTGLLVVGQGQLDARVGVVRECGVGFWAAGSEDYDPKRVADRVVYLDNGRDFRARPSTSPAVRVDTDYVPDEPSSRGD